MGRCHCGGCFKVASTWTFRPTRALRAALLSLVHHLFLAFRKGPQMSVIICIRSQQDALRSFLVLVTKKCKHCDHCLCQVLGEADWSHCRVWGMVSLIAKGQAKAETVEKGNPLNLHKSKAGSFMVKKDEIQELSTWYSLQVGHILSGW